MKTKRSIFFWIWLLFNSAVSLQTYGQEECRGIPMEPEDRRINKERLVVASVEAEIDVSALFDMDSSSKSINPVLDSYESLDWKTTLNLRYNLNGLAKAIRGLNADIVNIFGIENCSVLVALIEHLYDEGYRPYLLKNDSCYLPENVGLLTRIDPVIELQSGFSQVDLQFRRSRCVWSDYNESDGLHPPYHYWTKIHVNGMPVLLVGAYLHAFSTDNEAIPEQQTYQAQFVRKIIEAEGLRANSAVIFMGVFNNYDGELPLTLSNIKLPPERTGRFYSVRESFARYRWTREHYKMMPLHDVYSAWAEVKPFVDRLAGATQDLIWISDRIKGNLLRIHEGDAVGGRYPLAIEFHISSRESDANDKVTTDGRIKSNIMITASIVGVLILASIIFWLSKR